MSRKKPSSSRRTPPPAPSTAATAPPRRGWLRRVFGEHPRWVVALFAVLFVAGAARFYLASRGDTPQILVGGDGRYYWAYLTSMVFDQDFDFENQYKLRPSANIYRYSQTPTGKLANPFSIGPALLWMPFFAAAHGLSEVVEPEASAGGVSVLHQQVTMFGSYVLGFAAVLLVYAMARRRYGPGPAVIGALAAIGGGPVFHYLLNQPYYSHASSAFTVVAVLYVWDTGREGRSVRGWLVLGGLIGLAATVRAQNVVFALPAVVDGAMAIARALRAGVRPALRAAAGPLIGAGAALVAFSPQMLAWKSIYGSYFTVPQGPAYMRWSEPLVLETLFSSRNGLFPYAPLWALGMLGLALVLRRERWLGTSLLVTFALAAYLNGASSDWSGGGAFGGRRYDGLLCHVGLGIAALTSAFLSLIAARPRLVGAAIAASSLLGFATCNYVMMDAFRERRLPPAQSKDMLNVYLGTLHDLGRGVWERLGNPLSWPAAWLFSWRTGAPVARYDEVVGTFFLTDFKLEPYRFRDNERNTDELSFSKKDHAKFLVGGFGEPAANGSRPVYGPRARLLLAFNHGGGLRAVLKATSHSAEVRVVWNGEAVAVASVAPGVPDEVRFELGPDQVKRGINILELEHPGVGAGALAGEYFALGLEER